MPRLIKFVVVLFAGCIVAGWTLRASAIDEFILRKEEGWFWYQDPIEPKEPEPKPEEPTPPPKKTPETNVISMPKPEEPPPLSAEWFRKNYSKYLDKAVDDPSPENVAQYRYLTRVMLDKASNFARQFRQQTLLDPYLDESNRYPFANAMRGAFQRLNDKDRKQIIKDLSQKAGLWVFLDERCEFCVIQYPVIARAARENGFLVRYITPDGKRPSWFKEGDEVSKDMGQSQFLKIKVWPATALVVPPDKILVISQGLLSDDLIEERILAAADKAGLIPQSDRFKVYPNERGILSPQDIQEAGKYLGKDDSKFREELQNRIGSHF